MKSVFFLLFVASATATIYDFYGSTPNPSNAAGGQVLRLSGSFALAGTEQWRCRYRDYSLGVQIGTVSGSYISTSTVHCPSVAFVGQYYIDISDDNGASWYGTSQLARAVAYCPLVVVGGFTFNLTQPSLFTDITVFATGACGNGFWIEGGGQPYRQCNMDGTWDPVQNGECTEIPRPIIEYISPRNVGIGGGSIIVYGEGFTSDSECFFDGVVSTSSSLLSSTSLICTVPPGSIDSTASITVQNLGGKESQQTRSVVYTACSGSCPLGYSKSYSVVNGVGSDGTASSYSIAYATQDICSGASHGKCEADCTCTCNAEYGHSSLGNKNCDVKLAPSAASTLSASATLLIAALAVLALAL